jgi:hypothetical protein
VPDEPLSAAAATVTRAALGRHVRDIATSKLGDLEYRLLRLAPRRMVDRGTLLVLKRLCRQGKFSRSKMARDFVSRLAAS